MDDIERRVEDFEKKIAELPIGYISKKNIRGKIINLIMNIFQLVSISIL